ncbi:MAG TPA: SufD family Fe-S cluster assembly protein [Candidatus Saccharimonadales bacterium]|nr:SufD family Fe-S cluster assembly protein [Candidatus Saccharimonadales bacterium]
MHKDIYVKENEELFLPILWTGQETNLSYTIFLTEKGAKVTLLGLLLGRESHKVDIKTTILHQNQDTTSEVILKGALTDTAAINYQGMVKIDPGAKGTKAWLAAHLLLLSTKAKGTAIPSLEILENDIKAGHATTVGRVNDMELFYLMSRGLSKETAKLLIVEGFLQSILEKFPNDIAEKARKELSAYVS